MLNTTPAREYMPAAAPARGTVYGTLLNYRDALTALGDAVNLEAGDVVLAGSFARPVTAAAGDRFRVDYGRLGTIEFRFV